MTKSLKAPEAQSNLNFHNVPAHIAANARTMRRRAFDVCIADVKPSTVFGFAMTSKVVNDIAGRALYVNPLKSISPGW